MSLSENGGSDMIMPVQPMYGNNYGGGFGYPYAVPVLGGYGGGMGSGFGYGGDATWLIILFLFAAMGGWGGNGFGGFGGNDNFGWMLANNTDSLVQGGFNQATTTSLLGDIQNSITNGFSNAEVASCNRAMDAMQTAYNNQISGLERSFAAQTANTAAINGVTSQLADCLKKIIEKAKNNLIFTKYTVGSCAA